jgi:hypothetical protein
MRERPIEKDRDTAIIEIISGPGGICVAINDRRVAGPKPLGGGRVVATWIVGRKELRATTTKALALVARRARA